MTMADRGPPSGRVQEPITPSDTWTVSVASRVLGVSTAWLYKLVDANEIPHRRQGSSIFFDRRELSAWLAKARPQQ
jgi:excisionase family DNA binding protein